MITSVVAGLHSSAVKLTMIRRRSRALTHRTFPLFLSLRLFSLLSSHFVLLSSVSFPHLLTPEPLLAACGSLSFFIVFFFHEPAGNRCRVPERARGCRRR